MVKKAFIFPGQGSQFAGMGKDIYDNYESARRVFEQADEALGFSISEICFNGPEEKLKLTEITQPAILTVSIALFAALQQEGEAEFDFAAGHSLGEYSALVAANTLKLPDAVVAVNKRGKFMQEAVPVGEGTMAAIIGLDEKKLEEICSSISSDSSFVAPANYNSPGQVVIAGHTPAVETACAKASEAGAKRALLLPVSAPFHTTLISSAREKLAEHFKNIEFRDPVVPIVANVNAEFSKTADETREALVNQVTAPVRWIESIEKLVSAGVEEFVEIGPGKVLTGLVKRIDKSVRTYYIEDSTTLDDYLSK
ncbi:MAG: ACP S-malonyltransferase [Acidobacteria bacterium]|nr:ACP S-malonyltransferase [Acidobacteriota bacterium]